jgi:hypothetical protein
MEAAEAAVAQYLQLRLASFHELHLDLLMAKMFVAAEAAGSAWMLNLWRGLPTQRKCCGADARH